MIVCTKCGMHNADSDTFCGQCGSFLEWAGEKVAPEPAAAVADPAPAQVEEPKAGMVERVKAAIGIEARPEPESEAVRLPRADAPATTPAPTPSPGPAPRTEPPLQPPPASAGPTDREPAAAPNPAPPTEPPLAPPPTTPAGEQSAATSPPLAGAVPPDPQASAEVAGRSSADRGAGNEVARRAAALMAKPAVTPPVTVAPVAGQPPPAGTPTAAIPGARQPEAVKPGRPVNRPPPRHAASRPRTFQPGDLICGQCGEGNDPKRNFCHHCGASLQEAVVATVPWWRRILRHRPKKPVVAGTRPGGGRTTGNRRELPDLSELGKRLMVVVAVVVGIIAIAVPSVRKSVPRSFSGVVRKFIYHYVPVSISKVDAMGNEVPGHGAANVFQGDANSFWATPAPKPGTKPQIRVFFDRPHDVSLLRLTSGDPANFPGSPRPRVIEYRFSDGRSHPALQIENVDTPQKFKVSGAKATYVDIVINDVYPVAGSSFYAAVSRIEVFQKKAGR